MVPVCLKASPAASAAAVATLSERMPGCIGINSRASPAAWTAAEQPHIVRREAKVEIGLARLSGEKNHASGLAPPPSFEMPP